MENSLTGNLWVQQRQRTNGTPKWICDQLCTVFSKKIIGNVTAKNNLKESLSSILCFIIQGKGSSWKNPEILFVIILRIFDTIEFFLFTHVMK